MPPDITSMVLGSRRNEKARKIPGLSKADDPQRI
jgi:hypothetical protein